MLDKILLGVQVIQDHISITAVTGCEYDYLELGCQVSQKFFGVWADIDPRFDQLPSWELHWEFYIIREA